MAIGPATLPSLPAVSGVRLGTTSAGIKTPGRKDLVVMELAPGSTVAGLYTSNAFCAAPVTLTRQHMAGSMPRYLIINTDNANAGTGERGMQAAQETCRALAELAGVNAEQVLPFSTGVIGEPLPVDRIRQALPRALEALSDSGWEEAAEGILTTDTRPKGATRQFRHAGRTVTLTGITKGSGMIKPNMATMLAFVATDAELDATLLASLQREAVDLSFNRITVDGDTSTNDCSMLVATGQSGVRIVAGDNALIERFREALVFLYRELAEAIVRDGEGATKLVRVRVERAATLDEARQVAYTIAESPLVKTALFASDPNWGRILAAVGRSGIEQLDLAKVTIWLGDVRIVRAGGLDPGYREKAGASVMAEEEIIITVQLGRGVSDVQVLTTDLSYDYIKINADYRS